MDKFYYFSLERKKDEALIESIQEYDPMHLKRADLKPNEPFLLKKSEGKVFYDVVGYQDTANFAISEKLHTLLLDNDITGWNSYEIKIQDKDEKYYGFQVTGRCGNLKEPPEEGFYTGYKFDYDSWDGSDFFSPNETTMLFCTEKVRMILLDHHITNVELEDINNVEAYSFGNL